MEVDLGASAEAEQYGVEVDDFLNIDGNSFGGERCGICMDVIIDRGVLDCCQHWFCFGCIDNWATITNLCPLCQNEFQLITCVPVYDTIGSSKVDDESYPRDDDWLVEGKNNTLSFPSYYIDENAVICLDGSGCKIRNGSATSEEDADLDTSIACDSCDLWYHAFCVGFDTEGTSESTWLCPRCVVEEMPQNQEGNLLQLGEDEYTRKVSVSVADEGETAMVVSMVGPSKFEEIETDTKSQSFVFSSEDNYQMFTHSTAVEAREVESALPCETSLGFSNVFVKNELESFGNEPGSDPIVDRRSNFKGIGSLEEKSANELSITNNSSNDSFDTGVHQQQLHVDDVNMNVIEDGLNEGVKQNESLEESKPTAGKYVLDVDEDALGITGVKRKLWDSSDHIDSNAHEDSETEITDEISPPKKMRSEDQELKCDSEPENGAADIMSIVRSTKRRPSKGGQKCEDKSAIEAETTTGLRVKKIMKRASKDKESSVAVQTLRKEIREAVRNKSIEDSGENLFDPKLLAAFRVAVSSPKTESVKMMSQLSAKTKKLMLQKGKVRENLTKKIYSLSNGRRKRAWDRDCEVEFWKHRCLRASKPEKIETLKSVLDLLRNNSESSGTREKSERHGSDTILSRLYLADTSVCPRKDDIKPLAVLKNSGDTKPALAEKLSKSVSDGSGSLVEKKNSVASGKDGKVQISKLNARKETMAVKSGDVKVDKRKWALEVLARRASGGDTSASEKQGDEAVLKGNYPLLAQLPVEMRPVLAPSRRNKIPMSVRQAQLYRLTEQLLRKANLPVIRRSAETELAVADAINIERAVADRSSSKPVYINLCSQELRQHSENKPREAPEDDTSVSDPSTIPIEGSQQSEEDPSIQALRNAGLLSDSPPNSPGQDQLEEEEGPENVLEMDEVPDLDIYGEFEYSLDDEDYIGVSAAKAQPEVAAPKMKLVFSTLTLENPTNASDSDKPDACAVAEKPNRAGDSCAPREPLFGNEGEEPSVAECEELYGPDKESLTKILPTDESMKLCEAEKSASVGECSPNRSETGETVQKKEKKSNAESGSKRPDNSISKKVEAYIKEHVRPLCKSGIITVEQYRWAVSKTREKVMKYHSKAKNANFLIKEGEKVKKLAEQYVETAQQKE